jgi:trehalose 6-phosphate phosphatase
VGPHPEVSRLLERLARAENRRVAIVSGRSLDDLRRLVPPGRIFLAGTYGIELLTPQGEEIQRVAYAEARPLLEKIKPLWSGLLEGRAGFYLEDKGRALALHARFASKEEAQVVIAAAREAVKAEYLGDAFRLVNGTRFLEVAPCLATKTEAVRYLLEHYGEKGARLLYIGDDARDEEAYPLIHTHQGLAVKVSSAEFLSHPTEADFLLPSPQETRRWLEELAE